MKTKTHEAYVRHAARLDALGSARGQPVKNTRGGREKTTITFSWGSGTQKQKPWLVGGIPTPLKNDGVRQLGWWHYITFPTEWKVIKAMFLKPPSRWWCMMTTYRLHGCSICKVRHCDKLPQMPSSKRPRLKSPACLGWAKLVGFRVWREHSNEKPH